ncbi:MFS transporter [Scytonema tolypothrichoides VB-61278]|nr:MFS transporter [Scytonema tolypothrichoides VB-61278]
MMLQRLLRHPVYYGWPMLVAVSTAQVVSWGILYYAFSVFVTPMQVELGWTTVQLTGAYSLALLCSGLAAVPVGRWLDRHGPRTLMTASSALAVLLVLAWSQVTSLPAFYALMAGIGLVSAGVLYEPAFQIVAVWFRRLRGRALTVLTFFGAFASFVFIPLSAWLVQLLGWRGALVSLAGILGVVTVPIHAMILRRRPEDLGLRPDGELVAGETKAWKRNAEHSITTGVALRETRFWLLTFAFAASTFAGVTMTVHVIPFLIASGHSPSFASLVAGLFGLMSLFGRMTIAPLTERVPRQWVTAGLIGMQLSGLVVLVVAGASMVGTLGYVALFGAGSGVLTIMRAALLAEHYGPANYGTINGAQNLALTGARTLAPVGAGILVAAFGGYGILLWGLAGLLLLGIGAVALAGAPAIPGLVRQLAPTESGES